MWTDEVQTLWVSQSGDFKEGPMYLTAPLNFFFTGWAVELFGADALGARIIPFVAGTATVGLYFPLMRRWLGDRAALFGALVIALSFWHVFWSQNARHFALAALLLLVALHLFLRFWEEGRRWSLLGSCLLLLLAQFTHASSGFFVAGIGTFVVLDWAVARQGDAGEPPEGRRSRHKWALVGMFGVALVYLPIYLWVATYLLENKPAWNPPYNLVGSLVFYVSPVLAMFGLAGVGILRDQENELWLLLLCLATLPPILAIAASAFTIASIAYALPALLAIAALSGVAMDWMMSLEARRGMRVAGYALAAALILTQVYSLAHYYYVWNGLKPRWSEAIEHVRNHRSGGEPLWASEGDVARYYAGGEWADWFGRRDDASNADSGAEWFAVYLDSDQLQTPGKMSPAALRSAVPEEARVEAIFPLHYGAKNRTIIVYRSSGR